MTAVLSLVFFLLMVLGHGYFWTDAVNRLHAWSGPRKLIDVLSFSCFVSFLLLPIWVGVRWGGLELFGEAGWESGLRGVHYYTIFCAAWGAYSLLVNGLHSYATDNPRTLLSWQQEVQDTTGEIDSSVLGEGFPQLLGKVPGNQILQLTIDRKRLAIPRLQPEHEGLKIAHLSDLHMTGRIGAQWYELIAEQTNQLAADVIVVTGDIVEKEACWPWLEKSLGLLQAKYGVYFVLGNHDYYIDTNHTKQLLQDQGLICLSERFVKAEWNGAPVILAGNERPWSPQAADLSTAPTKNDRELPLKLALLHSPDQFGWAADNDIDLALAGHTHGGQLRFPLLGPIVSPSRYGTRYACGVFQRDSTVMHVSRGIAGKTPLRWNCPPEIALLELVRAS